ncbi:hypothetical protein SFA35_23925 [Pseudomonas sp. HR96]|uniref:hypothetical protein n=1 Tax=Pseudomonas sp. HR96 TaxID=1027966 RepID=UPI002A7485D9|nr:hypothetical protein [Pseudomonas sp. HR96]WPO99610.1 hypothetical protein SFA35_23925 [Pseudomonas sp. HR96]
MISPEHLATYSHDRTAAAALKMLDSTAEQRETALAKLHLYALVQRHQQATLTAEDRDFLATLAQADRYFSILADYRKLIG